MDGSLDITRLSGKGQMDHFRISPETLYILCTDLRGMEHGDAYVHFTCTVSDSNENNECRVAILQIDHIVYMAYRVFNWKP